MKYLLSHHAELRARERSISKKRIEEALRNPTKIESDNTEKILFKKVYAKRGNQRLLLIVGKPIKGTMKIITIIETSKVKKYL